MFNRSTFTLSIRLRINIASIYFATSACLSFAGEYTRFTGMPQHNSVMRFVASLCKSNVTRVTCSTPLSVTTSGYEALFITGCIVGSYSACNPDTPPHVGTLIVLFLRAAITSFALPPLLKTSLIVITNYLFFFTTIIPSQKYASNLFC